MLVHLAISIIALSRTPLKISNLKATTGIFVGSSHLLYVNLLYRNQW
jgi:hypothetical protein